MESAAESGAFNRTKKSSSASSSKNNLTFETVVKKRIKNALQSQSTNRSPNQYDNHRRYESALQRNESVNSLVGLTHSNSVLSIRHPASNQAAIMTSEVAKNHDETMLELLGIKPSKRSLPGLRVHSNHAELKFNSEHKPKIPQSKFKEPATELTSAAPVTELSLLFQSARKPTKPETDILELQETLLMLPRQRHLVSSLRKQQQRLFNLQAQTRVNPRIQSLLTEELAVTAIRGALHKRALSFNQDITSSPFSLRQPALNEH